jgi:hypothetical protein
MFDAGCWMLGPKPIAFKKKIFHFPSFIFHVSLKKCGSTNDTWKMKDGKWKIFSGLDEKSWP